MYLRSAERSFYPAWHVPEYGKSQDATRSHIVVGDVEFPEAREVRQPVQTSRSGPQSVAGEVELGQAGQMFQAFDARYLWAPTDRGGGAAST